MYQKPGTILSVSVVFNTTNGIDILVLVKILKPQTNKPQTPSHNLHRIVSRIVDFPIPASKLSQRSTILPAAMQNNDKLLFILVFNIWLNLCKFSKLYTSSSFGFSGQVSPQQIFHPHYFCGPIFCILLRHFRPCHVLSHLIHKPPFRPSPFSLSRQCHPQHPSLNIPIIFPP